MLRVKVVSTKVIEKEVTPRNGRAFVSREQEAICYTHNREGRVNVHGVPMVLSLRDREPYDEGEYWIGPESIYVNRWGQLEISPVLYPEHQVRQAA